MHYSDFEGKEQEYKTKIQQIELNLKFANEELKQSKGKLESMRKINSKQTEDVTSLNHDIKQLYNDLENTRMQLIQSQNLIQSLEKQILTQQQTINHTRTQLQIQLQLNRQHTEALNSLKNAQINAIKSGAISAIPAVPAVSTFTKSIDSISASTATSSVSPNPPLPITAPSPPVFPRQAVTSNIAQLLQHQAVPMPIHNKENSNTNGSKLKSSNKKKRSRGKNVAVALGNHQQ